MNQKLYTLLLLFVGLLSLQMNAQTVVTIQDSDLVGDTEYSWTKDNIYLLDGYVFLESGGKLNIQPGTVIKGKGTPSTGDAASALIISVGAQIFAEGTAEEPIIFTAESDDTSDPADLEAIDRGLWGGLIVLGDATIARPGGTDNIEGIPADQDKAAFGGSDDTDNSGVIRYISIRHGGDVISNGDEINGLTLGGVGSGTTIEYVEVFANDDDGIEWFGGTVSVKYASVAFCKDDSYDYDFGWRGNGQFWFTILDTDISGRGGEHDGASPDDQDPFSKPTISNATIIGPGVTAAGEGDGGDIGLLFRDRAGGAYWNSIITEFPGVALAIEDRDGADSYDNLVAGDLAFASNVWWDFGAGSAITDFAILVDQNEAPAPTNQQTLIDALVAGGNQIFTPDFGGVSRMTDGGLDPRLNGTSEALFGAAVLPNDDGYFDQVSYRGAFGNSNNWLSGWTAIDEYGYVGDLATEFVTDCSDPIVITDADLVGGETYNWTKDNCYLLDGYVFLEDGGTLNIEEGTIIKAKGTPSTGDAASALIISVGAQIFAEGTADEPIIFTSEQDDTEDATDLEAIDRGLWGGLIVLGDATIARPGGTDNIEGIPADQDKARFGGTDDTDNSGVIRYVSIRHGGDVISNGDEINGLTLGGVGSGTTIEYVEVFANDDDGIEWFGGTVSIKYASVAFCKDDSYDYDFGWRGNGQFWFTILDTDISGRGGEHDGASPDDQDPFSKPRISNATVIGPGVDAAPEGDGGDIGLLFRDRAGGEYWNSIITEFPGVALAIEDRDGADSYDNLVAGDLAFAANVWWDYGVGNNITDFAILVDQNEAPAPANQQTLIDALVAGGNQIFTPDFGGVSRITDGGLDPRLNGTSEALFGAATLPNEDGYFDQVSYRGAFGNSDNWLLGWTAVDEYGYIGDLATEFVTDCSDPITITDADLLGGQTYTWTKENCYLLDGYVFLEEGGVLNIEEGTIIKAKGTPSTGDAASALIISVGAQIFAEGTADEPIIFTSEQDDIEDATDLEAIDRGLWGGLIVLGDATIARPGGTDNIEGIPADQDKARFGGTDDTDNSGVIRYVSIRHGGDVISNGDEINGLTLGGVGSGTTIEYVEVFANDDDGIEWFGGTVSIKYASVAFCKDDSYDYDFGWRGNGQFWFTILDTDISGRGGEHDGASPDDQDPFSKPRISNATVIGPGVDAAPEGDGGDIGLLFRDRAGGEYWNSIITEFPGVALAIEDRDGADSYDNLVAGDLAFAANVWWDFGVSNNINDFAILVDQNEAPAPTNQQTLIDALVAGGNQIFTPDFGGVSRITDGGLDPRLNGTSEALFGAAVLPNDDGYFDQVSYRGAFGNRDNWLLGWTAVDEYGYIGDLATEFVTDCSDPIVITDADLVGGETYTWTKENCYLLDGYVFLEDGGTLNIEEGTIIKAKGTPSTGDAASALIISVGAQIFAEGTAEEPIIFTSEQDDIADATDLEAIDRGLWGGLIVLGDATIARPGGTDNIEGIPADQDKARFGGSDDTDNSGVIRYVSIRHGGDVISNGDEINGLTLGGVGSGTTIEYVEVFANDDDGIEWFGGTVSIKYASVAFCKDDSYDYDFGWRGNGQFWFTILDTDISGRGGEHDGASPDDQDPFSKPRISNATVIGPGVDAAPEGDGGDIGLLFRDRAGGEYWNSIITEFPGVALAIEDRDGADSYDNLVAGDLAFAANVWWDFGVSNNINDFAILVDQNEAPAPANQQTLIDALVAGGNEIFTPDFGGVSRITDGGLDPRLNGTSGALFGAATLPNDDGYFDQVSYRGAFGNKDNWLLGWTAVDEYGYLGDLATEFVTDCSDPIVITDADLVGGETYTWTKQNCYLLDGYVFLEAGGTLNIEEGTIIKAKGTPSTGDAASALIISVGAQIFAEGTADEPIIFTSEQDDIANPNDLEAIDRGLWGGLIVLGDATIARPGGTDNIEGIPADQDKAAFGGSDDTDNSGVIRYISIRHGGDVISNGDEINGLTLGGVGSGTTIEYVEVFANDDDGIEWFGGTVAVRYASVAFCKDDSYDYDFGWRGKGQFWFTILDTDISGRGGEHDGASPDDQDPFAKPRISNATVIGPGVDAAPEGDGGDIGLLFRDRAGGEYWNSIITQFPGVALAIEDRDGADSYDNLVNGDLAFANNIWWDFGAGAAITDFAILVDQNEAPAPTNQQVLIDNLVASGNAVEDPLLAGVSRVTDNGLDPRPQENGPAGQNLGTIDDEYFMETAYKGAFDPTADLWLRSWTALDEYGYLGDIYTSTETVKEEKGFVMNAPMPTPSFDFATIKFELPRTTNVSMTVFDLTGKVVQQVMNNELTIGGEHLVDINVSNMANGYYFVVLQAEGVQIAHKLIVTK